MREWNLRYGRSTFKKKQFQTDEPLEKVSAGKRLDTAQ